MHNIAITRHSKKYSDGILSIPILLILVILSSFWFFSGAALSYIGYLFIFLSSLSLTFLYRIKYKEFYGLIAFIILLISFKTISQYITHNLSDSGHYTTLISGIIVGYLANKYDHSHTIIKVLYYFTFGYALIILLVLVMGVSPGNIWLGSRNLSSQLFVSFGALFLFYKPANETLRFKNLFYLIVFIICVLSIGRSGIITSFVLLIAAVLETYSFKLTWSNIFKISFSILVLMFMALGFEYFLNFFNTFSKFEYLRSGGVEDSYRSIMIDEFFNNYNIRAFFFGMDLSSLPYISSFRNNPHNGYIYLHAHLGIIAVVMYGYILAFLITLIRNKDIVSFLAVVAMLLRLGTDSPPSLIFFAFIFLFMYAIFHVRKCRKNSHNSPQIKLKPIKQYRTT